MIFISGRVFPVDVKFEDVQKHEDDGVLSFPLGGRGGKKLLRKGPFEGLRLNIRYEIREGNRGRYSPARSRESTRDSMPTLEYGSDGDSPAELFGLGTSSDSEVNNNDGDYIVYSDNDGDVVQRPAAAPLSPLRLGDDDSPLISRELEYLDWQSATQHFDSTPDSDITRRASPPATTNNRNVIDIPIPIDDASSQSGGFRRFYIQGLFDDDRDGGISRMNEFD